LLHTYSLDPYDWHVSTPAPQTTLPPVPGLPSVYVKPTHGVPEAVAAIGAGHDTERGEVEYEKLTAPLTESGEALTPVLVLYRLIHVEPNCRFKPAGVIGSELVAL